MLSWSFAVVMAAAASVATAAETVAKDAAKTAESKVSSGRGDAKRQPAKAEGDAKTLSGMSILGNQEAPKALVIVPWKSSQLGDALGIDKSLDDSRAPVDKDVFMRELAYYEIRSSSK